MAVPFPADVTRPWPLTWRTSTSLVAQLREAVACALPCESVTVTWSCIRCPMEWNVSMSAVNVMLTGASDGFVVEPPQPVIAVRAVIPSREMTTSEGMGLPGVCMKDGYERRPPFPFCLVGSTS